MKFAIFIISVLVILIVLEFAFVQGPEINLDEYFEDESTECEARTNMDIDQDGYDDFTTINRRTNNLVFRSLRNDKWRSMMLNKQIKLIDFSEVRPEPNLEAIINCKDDSGHTFYIMTGLLYGTFNIADSIRFKNGIDLNSLDGWDGTYTFIGSYEITGDQFPELFFSVDTGHDIYPRSVFAYDTQKKDKNWTYDFANKVDAHLDDLNGDKIPEIIVYGSAPINGAKKGMLTDDRVRVTALDIYGKALWMKEFVPKSNDVKGCSISFLNKESPRLCVAITYIKEPRQTGIYVLDGLYGDFIDSLIMNGELTNLFSYCFSGMASAEIILQYLDNSIRIFNDDLKFLRETKFDKSIHLSKVEDINLDGKPEYFITTLGGEAYILDWNLDVIARYHNSTMAGSRSIIVFSKDKAVKLTKIFWTNEKSFNKTAFVKFAVPGIPKYGNFGYFFKNIANYKRFIELSIIIALLVSLITIRERKNRELQSFYESIMRDESVGVLHFAEEKLISSNKIAGLYLGFRLENLKNRHISSLFDKPEHEDLLTKIEKALSLSVSQKFSINIDSRNQKEEFDVRIIPIKIKEEKLVEYVLTIERPDISRKDWMTLAKGIAHDAKGPSGLASTQLSSLASRLDSGAEPKRWELIGEIKAADKNVRRSLDRIGMFLGVVKDIEFNPVKTDLNKFLSDFVTIRRPSLPKGKTLTYEPSLTVNEVAVDRQHFEMALDNLLHNAIDAMSCKTAGNITISTGMASILFRQEYGEKLIRSAFISISDTGNGIAKENLGKIFDLNFSTKESLNLGMGLYRVKKIVEAHKGKIEVDSYRGNGATFTIYIPVEEI